MAFVEGLDAVQGMIDYMLGQEGPYGFGSGEKFESGENPDGRPR